MIAKTKMIEFAFFPVFLFSVYWCLSITMDSRGRNTSLHIASETGDLRTVKMLLERGVNPNVINKIGKI